MLPPGFSRLFALVSICSLVLSASSTPTGLGTGTGAYNARAISSRPVSSGSLKQHHPHDPVANERRRRRDLYAGYARSPQSAGANASASNSNSGSTAASSASASSNSNADQSNSNSAGDDDQIYILDDLPDFVEDLSDSDTSLLPGPVPDGSTAPASGSSSGGISSGITGGAITNPNTGGPALTLTSSLAGVVAVGSLGSPLSTRALPVAVGGSQVQPGSLSASASGAASSTLNPITGINSNSISSVIDSDTTSIVTGAATDIVSDISGSANDVDVLPLGSSIAASASGAIAGIARAESASSGIINAAGSAAASLSGSLLNSSGSTSSSSSDSGSSSNASASSTSSSGGDSSSSASSAASSSPGSASSASASSGSSGNIASVSGAGAASGTLNAITGEVFGAATSIGGSGGLSLSSKRAVDLASISLDNADGTINLSNLLPSNLAEATADLLDRPTGQISNADLDLLKDIIASRVTANGDAAIAVGQLISDAPTTSNPTNIIQGDSGLALGLPILSRRAALQGQYQKRLPRS